MFNLLAISGLSLILLSLMLITTIDAVSINAQIEVNIADSENNTIDFLAVQDAQSGNISKINTTSYKLELNNVSNNTVLFSDRSERIIESIPTSTFIGNWTTGPNSFQSNPPNAVLIFKDDRTSNLDTIILELFNPKFDDTTNVITYNITLHNNLSTIPKAAGQLVLIIDSTFVNASPGNYSD